MIARVFRPSLSTLERRAEGARADAVINPTLIRGSSDRQFVTQLAKAYENRCRDRAEWPGAERRDRLASGAIETVQLDEGATNEIREQAETMAARAKREAAGEAQRPSEREKGCECV